jgi:hypothetical protein
VAREAVLVELVVERASGARVAAGAVHLGEQRAQHAVPATRRARSSVARAASSRPDALEAGDSR